MRIWNIAMVLALAVQVPGILAEQVEALWYDYAPQQ
jgi:hypothetical protein